MDRAACLASLDKLARRGRLPGFEQIDDQSFKVALFGEPFDRDLIGEIRDRDGSVEIAFRSRLRMKIPLIFIVTVVVSIWPGVELMDALIPASWGWIDTWIWYLPLVIGPLPFVMPPMWRKSSRAAADHLGEQLERIANATNGRLESPAA